MNKYNYLSKNVVLFTISAFGPKIISFLMVRLYTSALSTMEFGIAELITTTVAIAVPVFTICVDSGVLRFSLDEKLKKEKVLSTSIFILSRGNILVGLFTILGIVLFRRFINPLYFVYFLCYFTANSFYNYFTCYFRGVDKVNIMVEMSLLTTGCSCLLNFIFLIQFNWGIDGYMLASFGGTYLAVAWGLLRSKELQKVTTKEYDKRLKKEMEKYSFPLIFNQIGWWLNNSVDKYIVTAFLGAAMNGIYSVSYKIPTILSTISGVFANAWALSAIKEFDPEDKDGFVSKMYNLYNTILCVSCAILILLNIPIAKILYANEFFDAWHYTGPLIIAVIFGAFSGFVGAIFSAVKNTKIYSVSTIIGGCVNIVTSIVLVNIIGIMGVALGTLLANVVIWAIRFYKSREYIKLHIPLAKHFFMYLLLISEFLVGLQGLNIYSILGQSVLAAILILINIRDIFTAINMIIKKIKR